MAGIRRLIRWLLAFVSAAILVPVIGEFFIDFARERGLYEHPGERMEAIMDMIVSLGANPFYRLAAVAIVFFALGFWIDYLFTRRRRIDTDRNEFTGETIYLPDFLVAAPSLSGKTFERCLIRGPVFLKFQAHNTAAFCSSANPTLTILTLPEGAPIIGACIADHTTFRQCFFDTVTLVGTPEDTQNYRKGVDPLSLEQWKTRVNFRS